MAEANSNYEHDLRSIQQREIAVLDEITIIQSRGNNPGLNGELEKIRTRTMEAIYEIDEIIERRKRQEASN